MNNLETYQSIFVRHKMLSANDPDRFEHIKFLWDHRLIAIHYEDWNSSNPNDYKDHRAKISINHMHEFAKAGVIVGADYRLLGFNNQMLIGIVQPGSTVQIKPLHNRRYKTLQLTDVSEICYADHPLLAAIQPRLVTLSGWPSAKKYLLSLITNCKLDFTVESLAPQQLEVLCYEYLRWKGLLSGLLLPIGRTMIGVDIIGLGKDGKKLYAQVTGGKDQDNTANKIGRVQVFHHDDTRCVYFCPKIAHEEGVENSIEFISIERVFNEMISDPISDQYRIVATMLNQ